MSLHKAIHKRAKIGKIMSEFKRGSLHHGGSGKVVKDKKTALAIAFEEARKKSS